MGVELPSLIDTLVREEMRRLIDDARADGGFISAPNTARTILRTYPTCGFTQAELANRIMMAAADAGVAVELGRAGTGQSTLSVATVI